MTAMLSPPGTWLAGLKVMIPALAYIFNGHIDVVEVGLGWTVPPFEGVVKDGRVYGRGACDMKGGIAASLIAIDALLACGLLTRRRAGILRYGG